IAIVGIAAVAMMGGGKQQTPTITTVIQVSTVTQVSTTTVTQYAQQPTATSTVVATQTLTVTQTATQPGLPSSCAGLSGQIIAGGATFPGPQFDYWTKYLYNATGGRIKITYNYVGSGAGQTSLIKGEYAFAGSDLPLAPDRYNQYKGQIIQFPDILGSELLVYNVPEIAYVKTHMRLNLTAEIIAGIYMGTIRYWDDPAIKAVNPGLASLLPHKEITPVHRSDASGTTGWFTLFLSKSVPRWNQTVGWGLSVNWPVDQMGVSKAGQGNPGVAQIVLNTPYSIGYVEYNYWITQKDKFDAVGGYAYLRNDNDGKFYDATPEAVSQAAAAGIQQVVQRLGGFPSAADNWWQVIQVFANPPRGYPLVAFSFAMLRTDYSSYPNGQTVAAVVKCFWQYALTTGQEQLVPGYLPLPKDIAQIGLNGLNLIK
ncbi:MAG: phosphate ABC transporter substrate-binding protein PstS, partial [Thermoproteus sp.]